MLDFPNCPKCNSTYTYEDGNHFVCPECAHEWRSVEGETDHSDEKKIIKDSNKYLKRW
jgi:protein PhnA